MKMGDFQFGWFDLVVLGLIVAGVILGRKRGMSEEFPNLVQWILILAGGALLHGWLGDFMARSTGMGRLFSYVTVYLGWAGLIKGAGLWFTRSMGDRMNMADVWGKAEYPLGMASGVFRHLCMAVFILALLNARLYTSTELKAMAKFQEDNYGSISFPTLGSIQKEVFVQSVSGKLVKTYLEFLLIQPTAPKGTGGENKHHWRPQRDMDSLTRNGLDFSGGRYPVA